MNPTKAALKKRFEYVFGVSRILYDPKNQNASEDYDFVRDLLPLFRRAKQSTLGHLYFATNEDETLIKVGRSVDPVRRLKECRYSLYHNWYPEKPIDRLVVVLPFYASMEYDLIYKLRDLCGWGYPNSEYQAGPGNEYFHGCPILSKVILSLRDRGFAHDWQLAKQL